MKSRVSALAVRLFFPAILGFVATDVSAERVAITVLHTTDLHGHVLPACDYDGRENQGGLARCATEIGRIRETADNVLLIDLGDTYQGTPVSFLTRGAVMARIMNR